MLKLLVNQIKTKINQFFEDGEEAKRFFRVEYGPNADIAYHHWQAHRKLLNYPN